MEPLVKSSKQIMSGLIELDQMLTSEDLGSQYIKRLSSEMQQLHISIVMLTDNQQHAVNDTETQAQRRGSGASAC